MHEIKPSDANDSEPGSILPAESPKQEVLANELPTQTSFTGEATSGAEGRDMVTKIAEEDARKLKSVRERLGLLTSTIRTWWESSESGPRTNILYRPDRMYRCIGESGYDDFVKTGIVASKNSAKYQDVSFNIGTPPPLYMKGESGNYILEATADSADFKLKVNPYSFSGKTMDTIPYRSIQPGELTRESAIRIFRKTGEDQTKSVYEIVFDNIGDQALVEEV